MDKKYFLIPILLLLIPLTFSLISASAGNVSDLADLQSNITYVNGTSTAIEHFPISNVVINGTNNISSNITMGVSTDDVNCTYYAQSGTTYTYLGNDIVADGGPNIMCSILTNSALAADNSYTLNLTIYNNSAASAGGYLNDSITTNVTIDNTAPTATLSLSRKTLDGVRYVKISCTGSDSPFSEPLMTRIMYSRPNKDYIADNVTAGEITIRGTNVSMLGLYNVDCYTLDWKGQISSNSTAVLRVTDEDDSVTVTGQTSQQQATQSNNNTIIIIVVVIVALMGILMVTSSKK